MNNPNSTSFADTLIVNTLVVTMDDSRHVITDGAVAIRDDLIVAVGKTADVTSQWHSDTVIAGERFVVTPGLINTHVHITGEPLTRGFVPDDTPFLENVFEWLTPIHTHYTEEDEHISAQLAALEMLKSGTTSFLEAGTIRFIDPVVEALTEIGIRARVGPWAWDLVPEPEVLRLSTAQAISRLNDTMDKYGSVANGRIQAWPIIIGHTCCSDELWRAAKGLSIECGTGFSAHMSPAAMDPEGFLAMFGQRPMVHLDEIGVLGQNVTLTHAVHVDDNEVALLARTGTSISHCPTTALKVSYGVTQIGKFPEMVAAGVNVAIGTDGNNASNYHDLMRATYLVAGLFKDARRDATIFPAEDAFAMATRNGARALQAEHEIGSIETGKKADLVLHDTNRPEWRPLHNVANQLVWSADGRGVHTVFVDGRRVVDDYRCTTIDEDDLLRRAQTAGEGIVARSGLPNRAKWPTI
ncbi:amidohydrolase family protein [Streptomyces albipurpureus]|uniref:Amidohydrolase family protein n=1 Tax=Streptomyces albipurpureus TaxID=2897419 RepID=A0ABT0UY56_9ACTN|nr:amidohydrolase family protein [Streptomyces sp. CWNU-1]MCM2393508.1 amidohydrolase family protein [Streptomyces sp. CWNU-1]